MRKPPLPDPAAAPSEDGFVELEEDSYAPPADLDGDGPARPRPTAPGASRPPRRSRVTLIAGAGVVLLLGAALLAYRAHHRHQALQAGMQRAEELIRLDTAAGYREAADLLEPLSALDPLEAGSLRAYALAVLHADYRDERAGAQAEALLVEPGRAAEVPRWASLASGVLALSRRSLGDATAAAAAAQGSPFADALQARIALAAGSLAAAADAAQAAAADRALPAGLALHGDVSRRARGDAATARAAYAAALTASPTHPRAAYGLAKLALAGDAPAADAAKALERVAADGSGTPAPERARAALHLAALRIRAGDRAGAAGALDGAGLPPGARDWAGRAAEVEARARGPYRAVAGAPPALASASDDDPATVPAVLPPEPRPEPPPARKAAAKAAPARKASAAKPAAKAGTRKAATPAKKPASRTAAKRTSRTAR